MDSSMVEKVAQSYLNFYSILKQKYVAGIVANSKYPVDPA